MFERVHFRLSFDQQRFANDRQVLTRSHVVLCKIEHFLAINYGTVVLLLVECRLSDTVIQL